MTANYEITFVEYIQKKMMNMPSIKQRDSCKD